MTNQSKDEKQINQLIQWAKTHRETQPKKGWEKINQALSFAEKIDDQSIKAECHMTKGLLGHRLTLYDEGLMASVIALDLFEKLNDIEGQIRAHNVIGIYYYQLGRYEQSTEYYQKGLQLSKTLKSPGFQIQILNNLANVYANLNQNDEAIEYYQTALDLVGNEKKSNTKSALIGNMGRMYQEKGELKKALMHYRRSQRLVENPGHHIYEVETFNQIGEVYLLCGRLEKANTFFDQSLQLALDLGTKDLLIDVYKNMGKVKFMENQEKEGLAFYQKALDIAKEIRLKKEESKLYVLLSETYEKQKKYEKALKYHKAYDELEKELTNEDVEQKLKAMSIQMRVEKTQAQNELYRIKNIEMKEKNEELERSQQNIRTISEIGKSITSHLDFENILETLYQRIGEMMEVNAFGVAIYHKKSQMLAYKYFLEEGKRIPYFERDVTNDNSMGAWCIRNQKPIFTNNIPKEYHKYRKHMDKLEDEKTPKSLIYIPLFAQEKLLGALTVQSYHRSAYTPHDYDMVQALGSYVAIALNNSFKSETLSKEILKRKKVQENLKKTNKRLKNLLSTDVLTGIYNRRYFDREIQKYWKRCLTEKSLMSVLMIDIDFFKQFNDEYGHGEGDKVLRIIAQNLERSIREPNDLVARYGGEEFIVLLPDANNEKAMEVAQRLRKNTRALKIKHLHSKIDDILTISIGVATTIPDETQTIKGFMQKADQALYQAKDQGRDCVKDCIVQIASSKDQPITKLR